MALDRVWQTPVEACPHRGPVLAKLRNDGLLALLDDKKAGTQPNQNRYCCDKTGADACTFHIGLKTACATTIVATTAKTAPLRAAFGSAEKASQFAVEITP